MTASARKEIERCRAALRELGVPDQDSEFVHRYGQFFLGGVFWIDCSSDAARLRELGRLFGR